MGVGGQKLIRPETWKGAGILEAKQSERLDRAQNSQLRDRSKCLLCMALEVLLEGPKGQLSTCSGGEGRISSKTGARRSDPNSLGCPPF